MQEKKKVSSSSAVNAVGTYSLGEEIANAVTHGLAVLLSIAGLVLMIIFAVRQSAGALAIISTSIFGASMIILYTVSTLDHSAIYILIAGSYTPFCLITLGGTTGIVLCSVVWTIALFGACFQPLLLRAADWLNCVLYLALGWCIVFVAEPLIESLPTGGLWLLAAGGITYSLGIIFYLWEKLPYNHAVWHVFVLAGTMLQFFAVLFYVIPHGTAA